MNYTLTELRRSSIATILLVILATLPASASAKDQAVVPGVSIGFVKLGMMRAQVHSVLGKPRGSYTLPAGTKAEYFDYPDNASTLRIFYDSTGQVSQISSTSPMCSIADSISLTSTLPEVQRQCKTLQRYKYHSRGGYIDYYDNAKQGVAFEFTWADVFGESGENPEVAKAFTTQLEQKHMYAMIVHSPGARVLADSGDRQGR
jgi:hypothetical protein